MLEDGEATVIGQPMSLRKVVLPENVSYKGKTYKVTSVIEYAFFYCLSLTSITIPDSITSIGESAFCNELKAGAFAIYCEASSKPSGWDDNWNSVDCPIVWDCNNNEIADDGNIYYVSEDNISYALKDGKAVVVGQAVNLIGEVVLPASITYNGNTYNVTSIGTNAFTVCYALTSITIPDSVTSIGNQAFYNCRSLTSITIPDSVTSIGSFVFTGCSSLESIVVEEGNTIYHSEGNCLIETDSKTIIAGCKNSIIPSDGSVTGIGDNAFDGCSSLTSITIPDSVTSIGRSAFFGCSSLTSITIPNSVTSIGDWAFINCTLLTSITIGGSVTSIGDSAFHSCSSLESITIPDSVTSIGDNAFAYCRSLESITIPDSITSIGDKAFAYCRSLESITFQGSMEQWIAIDKDMEWNLSTGSYTVICTDGVLNKNGDQI